MTGRTQYSIVFVLLIAATGASGCYRNVATVSIDKSNRFVVTKHENAKEEDAIPKVEETEGGGQTLQLREEQWVVIRAHGPVQVPVDPFVPDGPSKTKKSTQKIRMKARLP